MNFDEFLKDAANQAEFDKRVAKSIETVTKKLSDDFAKQLATKESESATALAAKQKEIEDSAKLTEQEKFQKQLDKINAENAELKAKDARRTMSDKALAHIKEKTYDGSIADLIDLGSFKDDAEMATKLEELNTKFTTKVSDSLNNKLKEHGYEDLAGKAGADGQKPKDTFDFGFTSIKSDVK